MNKKISVIVCYYAVVLVWSLEGLSMMILLVKMN